MRDVGRERDVCVSFGCVGVRGMPCVPQGVSHGPSQGTAGRVPERAARPAPLVVGGKEGVSGEREERAGGGEDKSGG